MCFNQPGSSVLQRQGARSIFGGRKQTGGGAVASHDGPVLCFWIDEDVYQVMNKQNLISSQIISLSGEVTLYSSI